MQPPPPFYWSWRATAPTPQSEFSPCADASKFLRRSRTTRNVWQCCAKRGRLLNDEAFASYREEELFRALARRAWRNGYVSLLERANREDVQKSPQIMKALAFKTCCLLLLRRRPNMATRGEQQMSFESIKLQLEDVSAWLEANPSSSGETGHRTRYFAMENYRG